MRIAQRLCLDTAALNTAVRDMDIEDAAVSGEKKPVEQVSKPNIVRIAPPSDCKS